MTEPKGHCERNAVERGNLKKGTEKEQIASAKGPRNDGGIAMTVAIRNDGTKGSLRAE
jgi:hypothetical protein